MIPDYVFRYEAIDCDYVLDIPDSATGLFALARIIPVSPARDANYEFCGRLYQPEFINGNFIEHEVATAEGMDFSCCTVGELAQFLPKLIEYVEANKQSEVPVSDGYAEFLDTTN